MIIYKNGKVDELDLEAGLAVKGEFVKDLYNLSYVIST